MHSAVNFNSSAVQPLVWQQEGHMACQNLLHKATGTVWKF